MKEVINITNFSGGIINDDTIQSDKHFANLEGLDWRSKPGYLQNNILGDCETNVFTNDERILSFGLYNGVVYCATEDFRFYTLSFSGEWSSRAFTATSGYREQKQLLEYQGYLFFCKTNEMGYVESPSSGGGANGILNSVFSSGFSEDVGPHIMVEFNEKLYISDNNIICEMDGSNGGSISAWVFDNAKNKVENKITAMCLFGDRLAIGTEKGDFYLWDGESAGADKVIKSNENIQGFLEYRNTLLMFGLDSNYVYQYNGSDFVPYIQIEDRIKGPVWKYQDGFLFTAQILISPFYNILYFVKDGVVSKYGVPPLYKNNASIYGIIYGVFPTYGTASEQIVMGFLDSNYDVIIYEKNTGAGSGAVTYTELETVKYEFVNKANFKTLIKGIRIDGVSGGSCDLQYSIDGGDYSVARDADFGKMIFFLKRAETFQIKLTKISNNITGIKIFI